MARDERSFGFYLKIYQEMKTKINYSLNCHLKKGEKKSSEQVVSIILPNELIVISQKSTTHYILITFVDGLLSWLVGDIATSNIYL